jgi:hypothetical protein
MLIAAPLVATALTAAAVLQSKPLMPPPMPVIVDVSVAAKAPPALIATMLDEASAIWRTAGVTFAWQQHTTRLPSRLAIAVGDERGTLVDGALPIGWIRFLTPEKPERDIYVSLANARTLLEQYSRLTEARRVVMMNAQDALLGRALGRALAHELGHYLLGSKAHSARGLMQAKRSTPDLFETERLHRFDIDAVQRTLIAARLEALHTHALN